MKVKELMALLAHCDPELDVFTGWPIVAQSAAHQDSACLVNGVREANLPGRRFVLIETQGVNEVWEAASSIE